MRSSSSHPCLCCRLGLQEYGSALGALTSLASLQAIAAMQGAANLASASGIASLGGSVDLPNRHSLGGLSSFGISPGETSCPRIMYLYILKLCTSRAETNAKQWFNGSSKHSLRYKLTCCYVGGVALLVYLTLQSMQICCLTYQSLA